MYRILFHFDVCERGDDAPAALWCDNVQVWPTLQLHQIKLYAVQNQNWVLSEQIKFVEELFFSVQIDL